MKYYHQILICWILIMVTFSKAMSQTPGDGYRVVKSSNGQSFLLNTSAVGTGISTDVYFRMGSIYEYDSLSGISLLLSTILNGQIEDEVKAHKGGQIRYSASIEPEQIGFHFESSIADLDYLFNLINDKIMHPKFDQKSLNEAKAKIKSNIDSLLALKSYVIETKIAKRVWGKDFKKLNTYGDQQTYQRISIADVASFQSHYFLPFNNMVSVLGSFSEKEILDKLQSVFKDFKSREFNPELITKVIDFKPVINTVQLLSIGNAKNLATITYQNPGARQDREATYCAYILTQLINDKEGRIQKKLKLSGLRNLKAVFDCSNFYGTFVLSAEPDSDFVDAFSQLTQLIVDLSGNEYFKEGEVEKAQRNIEAEFKSLKTYNPKGFMALVARYRFSNDENYFSALSDSINAISTAKMHSYITDYFTKHSGIRCLYSSDSLSKNNAADQQYFPLDESITDLKFTYELNKTDIETDEGKQSLNQIIQWLRVNPDMHVQINGFADEGEFTKAYDNSILRFIDSTATFHKAMPDATKKGYLRIEFMRAMKIARAIYQAGISEDRIAGTSMVFSSDSNEGAAANRKCTLTFEKIRPRVSLYEYHFGKKLDENRN